MSARRGFVIVLLFAAFSLRADDAVFKATGHGNPDKGVQRRTDVQQGACVQCHEQHPGFDDSAQRNEFGLFMANDNELCYSCHSTPSTNSLYPGTAYWSRSTHATNPRVIRGGADPRPASDVNKCVNCHDPHGTLDAKGAVSSQLFRREPDICLDCHDGGNASDLRTELTRQYVHGANARGTHAPLEGNDPAKFAATPDNNRHVSCSDCHNSHQASADTGLADGPEASPRLAGVSRVQVINGPAGTAPSFSFRSADDPGVTDEYEICFKCHSSWTRQLPGKPDFALLTNPANPSYHPIQRAGKNPTIDPRSFVNGSTASDVIRCTRCHSSDDTRVRGPHASSYPYLLKKETAATTLPVTMSRNDICFSCHSYDVYADPAAPADVQNASRFNGPAGPGHTYHVATQRVACYSCHETHGSTIFPNLIAKRTPGIISFTQTPAGGTCITSCHDMKTYSVNYPR